MTESDLVSRPRTYGDLHPPSAASGRVSEHAVARWAGAISVAVGLLVFLGWLLGLETLTRISPGLPHMKANTACGLMLLGGALLLLADPAPSRSRDVAARLAALVVGVFGLLVLGEYLFGGIGVDTLLFADPGVASPGRPSPHTAVAFVFAAGALLALNDDRGRSDRAFGVLLGLFGAVVFAALTGYAYGVDYLRGVSTSTGMAVHTALTLAVVWVGIAWLRPERGVAAFLRSGKPSAVLVRRLGPAAILAPLALGLLRMEGERAGLYDPTLGVALLTLGVIGVLCVILFFAGSALDAADARRGRAESRLRDLIESAPDAMLIVDESGTTVLANAQAERVFGYSRAELIGKPVELLMPERFRARHRINRGAFVDHPGIRSMGRGVELLGLRKDGSELPVEISLSPLQTEHGMLVSAAVRDVSERTRIEHANRRLAAIVEQTVDAVVVATTEGIITDWNGGAERLFGYPAADAIGQRVTILVPPDREGEMEDLLSRVSRGESLDQFETVRLRRDGTRLDVAVTLSQVKDKQDRPIGVAAIVRDISQRKRVEGQLQYLADHDPLTSLFNRRRFEAELGRELRRASRYGTKGAVLAIDLDHFKYINDSFGHAVGDELITEAAAIFRARLRDTDVLARIGGDEFAAVLIGADEEQAKGVAATLLDAIRTEARVQTPRGPQRVTATIGIAPFVGKSDLTGEELLVEADIAMYDAKEAGRDRASVYNAERARHERLQARLNWAERIRQALDSNGFVFHAQPIVSLGGYTVPRHELLLRMVGEDGDLIPPGVFLHTAERMGLIQEIDRWALHEAVTLLAREQRAGNEIRLELNLSATSIGDPTMPDLIAHELEAAGVDGRDLCFEITETAAIVNLDRAKLFATRVRELGCTFALDDFGAGFASFYYLKHLPFDYLKIDGEFIKELTTSETDQLVVQSLVQIARKLGKHTIAEFVGDEETVSLLRDYGVDFAQGFYLSKPKPLSEVDLARPLAVPN